MRTFIFGIDGLTMRIMKPLMDSGVIPNFKSVYENGSASILKSVIPPLTPPGWASIYTGKNPGKHGLFEFTRRNGYEYVNNTCWDYHEAPPVWKYLADHGKKCILLNVPMYYPPLKINNCLSVSGFNAIENLDIYHPESLKNELLSEIPDYRIDTIWHHQFPEEKRDAYIKENLDITRARIKALHYLRNKKEWDFFFVVFTGTDRLQHFFWHNILDGSSDVIEYYKLLDEALGEVLDSLNKQDFFFVVSDHGFRPIKKNVNINTIIRQNGLLYLKSKTEIPVNYMKVRDFVEKLGLIEGLKKLLPYTLINKIHEHSKVEGVFSFKKIDWFHTKAFASSGTYGGITINLKGREPEGIVDEYEYEKVRDRIIEIFSAFSDEQNGNKKVVRKAYRREEIYSGKHIDDMPDIVLLSETDYRFEGTLDVGEIFKVPRSGIDNHVMDGEHEIDTVFICNHGKFRKEIKELSVNDIAPSVLNIFELPIPLSMDGKSFFEDYRPAVYLDELTGAVFRKGMPKKSLDIRSRIKKFSS